MQQSLFLSSALFGVAVVAQLSNIPSCAIPIAGQILNVSGCSSTDVECICKSDGFASKVASAVTGVCNASDTKTIESAIVGVCGNAGVTISFPSAQTSTTQEAATTSSEAAATTTSAAESETTTAADVTSTADATSTAEASTTTAAVSSTAAAETSSTDIAASTTISVSGTGVVSPPASETSTIITVTPGITPTGASGSSPGSTSPPIVSSATLNQIVALAWAVVGFGVLANF